MPLKRSQVEVLEAVKSAAPRPVDAYDCAKTTGRSAQDCGRALLTLAALGHVRSLDGPGTANDLAGRFDLFPE